MKKHRGTFTENSTKSSLDGGSTYQQLFLQRNALVIINLIINQTLCKCHRVSGPSMVQEFTKWSHRFTNRTSAKTLLYSKFHVKKVLFK